MPNKKRHSKKKGSGSLSPAKGIRAPFRVFHVFSTSTATVDPFPVYLSDLGDYITAERLFWKRWRLLSLTIRTFRAVMPVTVVNSSSSFQSAGDYHVAIGWIDTDNTTVSSTPNHNSLTQFSRFKASSGDCVLKIPRNELHGLADWYLCDTTGTPPDALQSPGTAFVSVYLNTGFNTSVTHVYFEGVVEFMDRLDSTVSLERMRLQLRGDGEDEDKKSDDSAVVLCAPKRMAEPP
jgi:hypothetical protein